MFSLPFERPETVCDGDVCDGGSCRERVLQRLLDLKRAECLNRDVAFEGVYRREHHDGVIADPLRVLYGSIDDRLRAAAKKRESAYARRTRT